MRWRTVRALCPVEYRGLLPGRRSFKTGKNIELVELVINCDFMVGPCSKQNCSTLTKAKQTSELLAC